jgi:hypothetical protein
VENKAWLFSAEDEDGAAHYLSEEFFIGTYAEACKAAEAWANEWENKTGGLVLRLVIESHGKRPENGLEANNGSVV